MLIAFDILPGKKWVNLFMFDCFSLSDLHHLTTACDQISELVQYVITQSSPDRADLVNGLPESLSSLVNSVVIGESLSLFVIIISQ